MKLTKCDRCEKILDDGEQFIIEISYRKMSPKLIDLCPECYELFKRFIRNGRIGE